MLETNELDKSIVTQQLINATGGARLSGAEWAAECALTTITDATINSHINATHPTLNWLCMHSAQKT